MWTQAKGFKSRWYICRGFGKLTTYRMKCEARGFNEAMCKFKENVSEPMSVLSCSKLDARTAEQYRVTADKEYCFSRLRHSMYFVVSGESNFEPIGNCDVIIANGYDSAIYIYQDRYPNNVCLNVDALTDAEVASNYNIPFRLEEAKFQFSTTCGSIGNPLMNKP